MRADAAGILCLVTDRRRLTPDARTPHDEVRALDRWLDEAIDAGVDLIQIRELDLDAGVLASLTRGVAARAAATRSVVIVNDRADVAFAAGAGGVHLRADGPPTARVRAIAPAGWRVGRSVHTLDEVCAQGEATRLGAEGATARFAEASVEALAEASYLIFGTIFPSESKADDAPVQGIERLRDAARASVPPLLAIGGIDPDRARQCADAGAAGIAAIGMFLPEGRSAAGLGITRAVRELREAFARRGEPAS